MALGRGLDALIPDIDGFEDQAREFFQCDIEAIRPNRYQPRREFSENELKELSLSIEANGVLQPLLVRKDTGGYELIAGERRLRAAKMAGLKQVPVVIKDTPDTNLLQLSIIENIQRENLNPMEEADAYQRLMDDFGLTQEQIARHVGKSRSAVANFLRLRNLSDQIKKSIRERVISMGHARALLGAENAIQQRTAFRQIISKDISVRQTEALIKRLKAEKGKSRTLETGQLDRYLLSLSEDLSRHFGTKIAIRRKGQRGKIEIEFYNDDDLDRLITRLNQS